MVTARAKKRKKEPARDPLDAYRRVRKPVPPPGRPIEDRRRKVREEQLRKDVELDE